MSAMVLGYVPRASNFRSLMYMEVHGSPFLTCQFIIGPLLDDGCTGGFIEGSRSPETFCWVQRINIQDDWKTVLDTTPHSGMCSCCVCPFPCSHDLLDSRSASWCLKAGMIKWMSDGSEIKIYVKRNYIKKWSYLRLLIENISLIRGKNHRLPDDRGRTLVKRIYQGTPVLKYSQDIWSIRFYGGTRSCKGDLLYLVG